MRNFAQAKKTFNHIPTVGISAFAEARAWMDKFCAGYIDPAEITRLMEKGKRLMNSRKAQVKRACRPSRFLDMTADANVVRRPSGLFVPPKYRDV